MDMQEGSGNLSDSEANAMNESDLEMDSSQAGDMLAEGVEPISDFKIVTVGRAALPARKGVQSDFYQDLKIAEDSDAPLWQLPTDRHIQNGRSVATIIHSPEGKLFVKTCQLFGRNWECESQDALPDEAKTLTPYSLALLVKLGKLSRWTKKERIYGHEVLVSEWKARLQAYGYPSEPSGRNMVKVEVTGGPRAEIDFCESFIEENDQGVTLADVQNAIGALKKRKCERKQLNTQPLKGLESEAARKAELRERKKLRRQRKSRRNRHEKQDESIKLARLLAKAEEQTAFILNNRRESQVRGDHPTYGMTLPIRNHQMSLGQHNAEAAPAVPPSVAKSAQSTATGNSFGDANTSEDRNRSAQQQILADKAVRRTRDRPRDSPSANQVEYHREARPASAEDEQYSKLSQSERNAFNQVTWMLDARLNMDHKTRTLSRKKTKKLEAMVRSGGRKEGEAATLPSERFGVASLRTPTAGLSEQGPVGSLEGGSASQPEGSLHSGSAQDTEMDDQSF
ncbi:hypothetical protein KC343_g6445 [Hortaea werneckii]|nr:hypothetical protein KC352_g26333 [Hortaea werneckii]KAI7546443.1 hypothetical protein KC317_g15417 [Hortaea werneckii]KAI7605716.1 hypothetical protein KC346_g10887 [Hortaea werneckii]KAI7625988.1 hypothetical protein KC343_g6445 [Hortaea werneckii]KAI7641906.1 hypothetical protein KC319_g13286 [Hortaea werneckii]